MTPEPLVPAGVDLRDFGFMPLDVRTLLSSSLWIKAKKDPRVAHAAVSLWCESWHQVPAASLPDDDKVLADLARCDEKEWKRIRERALAHFVKCSDGRLYHETVARKALEAWESKTSQRRRTEAATAARAKSRQRDVQRNEQRDVQRNDDRDVVRDAQRESERHVHQERGREKGQGQGQGDIALASDSARGSTPEADVCRRLKSEVGMPDVNPSNQALRDLLRDGATADEIVDCAREKRAVKGAPPGFAYVLATVRGRLNDPKPAPGAPRQPTRLTVQADVIRQLTTSDPGAIDG
jgi:uncharacterized protein YdaU (DUF1376 family)